MLVWALLNFCDDITAINDVQMATSMGLAVPCLFTSLRKAASKKKRVVMA